MTAPVQPQVQEPSPHEYLMYLRDTGQRELAAEFEQYLRETGQETMIGLADRQAEFASGRMGRRIARENLNDREMAEATTENPVAQALGGISALGRDIPGVEAASAFARSTLRSNPQTMGLFGNSPQSYGEARSDIRAAQESNPATLPNRIVGGGLAAAVLPGSAARQGATYGGLLNALSADDEGLGERALKTAGGAAIGGTVGKIGDVATTGIRALRNPGYEALEAGLQAQRRAATAPIYAQAEREGFENLTTPVTPELDAVLQEPDVARVVQLLRQNREFREMPVNDPRFLSEISQVLTDAKTRAQSPTATDNFSDVIARNLAAAKGQFADAVSGPRGPMPTFAPANMEYAAQSGLLEGLDRGAEAMYHGHGSGNAPGTLSNLAARGPRSLLEFLKTESPEVAEQAARGAESALKRSVESGGVVGMVNPLRTMGRASLMQGGDLLRQIDAFRAPSTARGLTDFLRRATTAGATPDFGGP